ncbi:DUF1648 domain-containing protein [uncultured Thiodictyon sp.]|uniref:DUF1648 domain-containing protein n=1 Tax=uncultured Thiodictyon sp. TaxID=1846217 RepID=UPI0025E687F7|nr:DUF1648 domain-containing protein [uncultured Thiodictyon sp.]
MQRSNATTVFLVIVIGAAAFVWFTSLGLPPRVASHFGAAGLANGFMPRDFYVRFMLGFVVVLPSVLVLLPAAGLRHPRARINLPNRDYWLAPARRTATVVALRAHMAYVGCLLAIFLCYVHWLVVRANALAPPHLSMPWFFGGLAAFAIATVAWALLLIRHFRNVPR